MECQQKCPNEPKQHNDNWSSKVGSLFALIYGPHLCLSEFRGSIDTLRCVCQPTGRLSQTFVAYHVPCADGRSESRENDDALMTMRIHRIVIIVVISEAMHCTTYKALRNDVSSWGRFSTPTCGRYLPTT
ncbi:hypothetical protein T12_12670 [Trichinella patagoniensis]|uniref:Uncharacterized protein n=1 Tax=Trichinella patagoniensis TaxID=990121 RepID=A0A0V1A4Z4_9BILA|nr:hypothetical protein T12_12670 [Trichinella patagoniensis]